MTKISGAKPAISGKTRVTGPFRKDLTRLCLAAGITAVLVSGLGTAGPLAAAEHSGDLAAGEARYGENCVDCHGASGKGMASFPALKGRDAAYISDRLTAYRARERVGPNSAIMMSWAEDLSDADIANLASYISATFP